MLPFYCITKKSMQYEKCLTVTEKDLLKLGPYSKISRAVSMNVVSMESKAFLKYTRMMRVAIFFLFT